ncbi:hypothetical protein BTZ20_0656 [Rhodococcus sp. MTM3W5.2]|nr:hypothetical protein BTZ20_0656 [Rhodococcus sp. MTM3W5.2]
MSRRLSPPVLGLLGTARLTVRKVSGSGGQSNADRAGSADRSAGGRCTAKGEFPGGQVSKSDSRTSSKKVLRIPTNRRASLSGRSVTCGCR